MKMFAEDTSAKDQKMFFRVLEIAQELVGFMAIGTK